jgi:uncharacterized membrane protein YhhN
MNLPTGTMGALCLTFFILSLLAMITNLVSAFLEKETVRKISKPFCLLFLGIAVAFAIPNHPMVYLGAFMGFLGDIALIWKDDQKCVGLGVLCFWAGHGLYIATILQILYQGGVFKDTPNAWLWMLLFVLLFMGLMVYPMWRLTNHSKIFAPAGVLYSTILVSVGASAAMGCFLGYSSYLYLVILGDVCFIISDSFLAYTIFIKDVKRRDFYIMLSYLFGELLILSGLVFTLLK